MKSDLITGLAGAAFAAFYLLETSSIRVFGGLGSGGVNAQTVPRLWGFCFLALSVMLVVRSLWQIKKGGAARGAADSLAGRVMARREVVYTFVLLVLYAALMKPVGFIPTSIVYVYLQCWVLTPLEKRTNRVRVTAGVLAVFFSVSLYYVFTNYLMVMLPPGILK